MTVADDPKPDIARDVVLRDDGTISVSLFYPPRDADDVTTTCVEVELMHVRAADVVRVRFDFKRNGWRISMDRTRDAGGAFVVVLEDEEVCFIPAWNEEETH